MAVRYIAALAGVVRSSISRIFFFDNCLRKEKEDVGSNGNITPRTDKILIRNCKKNQSKTNTNLRRDLLDNGVELSISIVPKIVLEVSRKNRSAKMSYTTIEQMIKSAIQVGFPDDEVRHVVESIPKRIEEVICGTGGHTLY
ncbi:hypothetical protein TNCV_4171891 [Trichonephila clavipes]|nr:hypothetical protein TNCV_4171891 [Trichonephila clavipes]